MDENKKNIEILLKLADDILSGRKVTEKIDAKLLMALKQLLNKTECTIDSAYRSRLDVAIRQKLKEIHQQSALFHYPPPFMKYTLTFLAGTFAALFIGVFVVNQLGWVPLTPSTPQVTQTQTPSVQVNEVPNDDFGDVPSLSEAISARPDAKISANYGVGGGGIAAERSFMPPYPGGDLYPPEVKYIYSGDRSLSVPQSVGIYRARENVTPVTAIESLVGAVLGVNIKNLMSSTSVMLQNMNFQDPSDNINYSIDLMYGQVNFYTYREFTGNEKQPTEKDIPSDDVLISMANNFLTSKGFSLTSLEKPEVDKEWYKYFLLEKSRAADEKIAFNPYIPREIQVIYPMKIEGVQVVSFGGTKEASIRLSIDIIDKKVVSGNFTTIQNFDKTDYAAETAAAIIATLEKTGGTNAYNFGPRPLELRAPGDELKPSTIDVDYKTGELAYVRKDSWKNNRTYIYFIPVVMFKGQAKHSEQKEPYDQVTFVPVISAASFK